MKLLYVTHHRRSKTAARSGPLAREMARRGHEVTVICVAERERWRTREVMCDGVRWVEAPDWLWGRLRSGWDLWSIVRRLQWLRGRRFDLIHCFETRPATIIPVLYFAKRYPADLVIDWNDWWGRGGLISELRPKWYQVVFGGIETFFEEHYRPLARATTVISSALAERAVALGVPRESIFRVQGGVDPAFFKVLPREQYRDAFDLEADAFILGFSAADVITDLRYVLEEFAMAAAKEPDMLLVITGNKAEGFDRLVVDLGITSRVRHLGYLPYQSLPNALSCCDAFLLPFLNRISNVGRWPHKVGEYMSMGRPIVANAVGDLPELFHKADIGIMADTRRGAFAEAILKIKRDPVLRESMGRNARMLAEREYIWPKIADRMEEAYEYVLSRRPQAGGRNHGPGDLGR